VRANGVHHRPDIVHSRLERRRAADTIGHTRSPLVEADQPRERLDLPEERGACRDGCFELEVTDESRNEDDVKGAIAADLVSDVDVAALRVARLRLAHATSLNGRSRRCNRGFTREVA
jgi:hypothetical protein